MGKSQTGADRHLLMPTITQEERAFRAALYEVDGIGPARMRLLLNFFGSAGAVWRAQEKKLLEVGLSQKTVGLLVRHRKRIDPDQHLAALAKLGIRVCLPEDKEYPKILKEIDNPPQVLFVRGHFDVADSKALAVVGTRKPTPYGRDVTARLVEQLVAQGFTIVSGLARGIDGAAHRTALECGGRTIAVLGGGVDRVYPPEHIGMAAEIAKHGALISEFAPGKLPVPGNFPARNRIISGLSLGVLVVEGAANSGTKITARLAGEQGREVFAVPGPITSRYSQAPADLIKLGAKPVTDVSDIVEELALEDEGVQTVAGKQVAMILEDLGEEERRIVESLAGGSLHVDDIVREVKMETAKVSATLTLLELKGVVKHLGGMVYSAAVGGQ